MKRTRRLELTLGISLLAAVALLCAARRGRRDVARDLLRPHGVASRRARAGLGLGRAGRGSDLRFGRPEEDSQGRCKRQMDGEVQPDARPPPMPGLSPSAPESRITSHEPTNPELRVTDILVGEGLALLRAVEHGDDGESREGFRQGEGRGQPAEDPPFPRVLRSVARRHRKRAKAQWELCSPDTVGGFSATAYFFGRDLHRKLGVPVGLINSSRRRHAGGGVDQPAGAEGFRRVEAAV